MKNIWAWVKKNPNRTMFLIPIILVAGISISHVVAWYDIANPISWAIYLSIAIEVAAMTALVAAMNKIKGGVWFMFGLVTFVQMIGNIFFSFKEVDPNSELFKSWIELTKPVWETIGSETDDITAMKRWLAFLEGGLLPIISLTSLHFFIKYDDGTGNKIQIFTNNNSENNPTESKPSTEIIEQNIEKQPILEKTIENSEKEIIVVETIKQEENEQKHSINNHEIKSSVDTNEDRNTNDWKNVQHENSNKQSTRDDYEESIKSENLSKDKNVENDSEIEVKIDETQETKISQPTETSETKQQESEKVNSMTDNFETEPVTEEKSTENPSIKEENQVVEEKKDVEVIETIEVQENVIEEIINTNDEIVVSEIKPDENQETIVTNEPQVFEVSSEEEIIDIPITDDDLENQIIGKKLSYKRST